ncbi:MAG: hypothetical protein OXS47_05335 [Chloroflexota bacterium]|nr:hypothetical protein [Chloroflexota bacterium]
MLAALLALGTLALLLSPGAGQTASAHDDCPHFDLDDLFASVEDVDVIVVGELVTEAGAPAIAPEAYLKGPAIAETLPLSDRPTDCDRAALPVEGARVLAALRREGGAFHWPVPAALFVIEEGVATNGGDAAVSLSEDDLVTRIREVSGQYAVLATDVSEGASIDWLRVVLPVTLAAIVILAIALVLLRIWHRIDPEG